MSEENRGDKSDDESAKFPLVRYSKKVLNLSRLWFKNDSTAAGEGICLISPNLRDRV